jgi:hypothetical protein
MCACCSPFQLSLSSCMLSFPKMLCFSSLAYLQQAPNIDMWLVPSHLTFVCFLDLPSDRLDLFLELCCLFLCLCSLLIKCVHYLGCNFIADQFHELCLGIFYLCLGFLYLYQDFCYRLLQ